MKHITGLAALILAAGLFFSCTDGNYAGSGGAGNFNFIDPSGALNGKYIYARATSTASGDVGLFPRQKVNKGKVKAPLYYMDTGIKYTGSDTFTTLTVTVYATEIASTAEETKTFSNVKFYEGSGLVEYGE